jgi:hypothetical protein
MDQRELNYLWRARLSCGHMIRLLTYPSSPQSPIINLSLFLRLSVYRRSIFLTREWGRVGEAPKYKTARKPGPL